MRNLKTRIRAFLKPVEESEVPPLRAYLRHGSKGFILITVAATLMIFLAFVLRGGEGLFFWITGLSLTALQLVCSGWTHFQRKKGIESTLWPCIMLVFVALHLVMNSSLEMARISALIFYLGFACCVSVFVPFSPLRVLLFGVSLTVLLLRVEDYAFGFPLHTLLFLHFIGFLLAGLAALSCQIQRHFWRRFYQKRRGVQALERLESLGRRTSHLVDSLEAPALEGLEALQHAETLRQQFLTLLQDDRADLHELRQLSQALENALQHVGEQAREVGDVLQRVKSQTTLQGTGEARLFDPVCSIKDGIAQARYDGSGEILLDVPGDKTSWQLRGDPGSLCLLVRKLLVLIHSFADHQQTTVLLHVEEGEFLIEIKTMVLETWRGEGATLFHSDRTEDERSLVTCRDLVRGFLGGELDLMEDNQQVWLHLAIPLADLATHIPSSTTVRAWAPAL